MVLQLRRLHGCQALLVEIVFHDRAVAAVAVALERIDVALERSLAEPAPRRSRRDPASVSARSAIARLAARCDAVARADDDGRRPPAASSIAALATVAMSLPWRSAMRRSVAQQLLEQRPAAEIVDDQLVFGQRAVLEAARPARARRASGRSGSRRPPCRSRTATRRARPPAGSQRFSGRRSSSEYCTCMRDQRHARRRPWPRACARCRNWCAPMRSILPPRCSSASQPAASRQPGTA